MYKEYSMVMLKKDEGPIKAGTLGVVLQVHEGEQGGYLVEFEADENSEAFENDPCYAVIAVGEKDVVLVSEP